MKTALTIAGSDSSGGAGIQADLKTMLANGVYGMSAVTALTAQNTLGVSGILEATPEFLSAQMDAVFQDIRPDAVKVGMVSSAALIAAIARKLREYRAEHVVVDPVMVATSGARLIQEDAVQAMKEELFPLAEVITPNLPELECLSGESVHSKQEMESAAGKLQAMYHTAVLGKGGHFGADADDVLCTQKGTRWYHGTRIENPNTHGTGCTLSSAIAANLAKGCSLEEAVGKAKEYLSGALSAMLDLGQGSGPLNHGFALEGKYVV